MAYFNKKVKILSGNSNVKIFNPRNAVDLRSSSTVKKKVNLPSNNGTGTFLSGTQAPMSVGTPATSNTALQGFLQNNMVWTRTGTMFSPVTALQIQTGERKLLDNSGYTRKVNPIFKGGSYPKKSFFDTKPLDYVKKSQDNPQNKEFRDKLFNLFGRTVDSWNEIPEGVGALLSGTGAGVAGVGAGVENTGKALDNNFMWIAVGLVAVLLLTKK